MVSIRCCRILWDHIVLPDFMESYSAAGFYGINNIWSIHRLNPVVYDMILYFKYQGQLDGTSGRYRILWNQLGAAGFYGFNNT